jgi:hypothetical protein
MGEETSENGLLWNAPVANDPNLIHGLGSLREGGACGNSQNQQHGKPRQTGKHPTCAGGGIVLDLHRVGILRRAQVLVRSKEMLHGKNMHTLIA